MDVAVVSVKIDLIILSKKLLELSECNSLLFYINKIIDNNSNYLFVDVISLNMVLVDLSPV